VNNAARSSVSLIQDTPLQIDRDVMEIVVIAQIALTKAVLPHFIDRQSGQFVVTNSTGGKFGEL
jgi:short-subunit dehydrogenase